MTDITELMGVKRKVLDQGFIRLVDVMGGDEAVVQAARVSYGTGTKTVHDDRGLIRYLMRHRHTTPFEMAEVKFHVRVPMDCWRQWIRHRTASVNEYSTRYSEAIDAMQETPPEGWRSQSTNNKQGSGGLLPADTGELLSEAEGTLQDMARTVYCDRLAAGVAKEQARKDLPLSTYTEAYWKTDLHNLLHFLGLRLHPHAQLEIRSYAEAIAEVVKVWVPLTWRAFQDYRLQGMSLSRQEVEALRALLRGGESGLAHRLGQLEWLTQEGRKLKRTRECKELEDKLARLGVVPSWL